METPKQLRYRKSGGAHIYYADNQQIEGLQEIKINKTWYSVKYDLWLELVHDDEKEYRVVSKRYYVTGQFAGVNVKIMLDELLKAGAKITPMKFVPGTQRLKIRKKRVKAKK